MITYKCGNCKKEIKVDADERLYKNQPKGWFVTDNDACCDECLKPYIKATQEYLIS